MSPRPLLNSTTSRNANKVSSQTSRQDVHPNPKQSIKPSSPQSKLPPAHLQKMTHRSSKPILHWFQRKLSGTVRSGRHEVPSVRGTNPTIKNIATLTSRTGLAAGPVMAQDSPCHNINDNGIKMDTITPMKRKTGSLNQSETTGTANSDDVGDGGSTDSSIARDSTWLPASPLEADEDASVRPLPPSAPPSPSPSRSSSYLSDPRTFKSLAASTKPTTVLSIDLPPHGMAHIAQVPATMTQTTRLSHVRSSSGASGAMVGSGASITFSALPPSPPSSSPSSLRHTATVTSSSPTTPQTPNSIVPAVQAPLHTTHHPRNNPRPSSPPMDNASMLTLASSAFALPGSRMGTVPGWSSVAPSAMGADSVSQFDGISGENDVDGDVESASQYVLGDYGGGDVDASVRALRPRSSRRASWDSEASGWSARVGVLTSPSLAERSLRTSNSVQTGGQASVDHGGDEASGHLGKDESELSQGSGSYSLHAPDEIVTLEPKDKICPTGVKTHEEISAPPEDEELDRRSSADCIDEDLSV